MFDQSETVVWEDVPHFPICLFHLQSDRKITDADNRGKKCVVICLSLLFHYYFGDIASVVAFLFPVLSLKPFDSDLIFVFIPLI